MNVKRGEIYWCSFDNGIGSEQSGARPILVIQNDIGNKFSPTTIGMVITTKLGKHKLPTHVQINGADYGLQYPSLILAEQIYTIDKTRLKEKVGIVPEQIWNKALKISLGL